VRLALAAIFLLTACSRPEPQMQPNSSQPADPRAAAGERLALGERTLVLEAALWRNFMPVVELESRPRNLHVHLRISEAGGGDLPERLEITAVCVRHGPDEWRPQTLEHFRESRPDALTCVARGGPAWPIGEKGDVFAFVRLPDGSTKWLVTRGVPIRRVD
jgi:putative hemolysin